jgi:uncharacterized membrane protein
MRSEFHRKAHKEHSGTFGSGGFGAFAESIARFFGTPQYLIGQTVIVAIWVIFNGFELFHFDPYPFILLNLAFSLQAAYAAPLILLAQTRQTARDKAFSEADAQHREAMTANQTQLLIENTRLTEEVHRLTEEVHRLICNADPPREPRSAG